MRLELFIALRHLKSRDRRALISIITAISILGVVVGVTALIVVIAVMDGAQEDYLAKMIDEYAHIEVWDSFGEIKDYHHVIDVVESDPEVIAASPVLQRFALLKRTSGFDTSRVMRPARIFGIDPEQEKHVSRIGRREGGFKGKNIPGPGEIVLGAMLANQMGLARKIRTETGTTDWIWDEGAELYAVTGKVVTLATGLKPKQARLKLVGIFESGMFDVDQNVGYTSLETCQRMNVLGDVVDLVHAKVQNPHQADSVKDRLQKKLGPRYVVRSWGELNPELFKALALEKIAMFVILLLVVAVAGLNIIATLILVTMEKTREIGILRAMGASRGAIARVFILEGALIGCIGTTIGVLLGLALCWVLEHHCPIQIPEAVYGLDGLPVLVKPMSVALIVVCSIGICLLAAVIPAFQAARLDIVEALRHD